MRFEPSRPGSGPDRTNRHTCSPSNRNLPIDRTTLDKLLKGYGEKAKLPDDKRHFHVLNTASQRICSKAGADLRFVQDWLGHSNIQNTIIYTHLVSHSRTEKARALFMRMVKI